MRSILCGGTESRSTLPQREKGGSSGPEALVNHSECGEAGRKSDSGSASAPVATAVPPALSAALRHLCRVLSNGHALVSLGPDREAVPVRCTCDIPGAVRLARLAAACARREERIREDGSPVV
jgi:hypothetical protein